MMKKNIFTLLKWIAAIYSLGYIIFGYPTDTYFMRAITGMMMTIFAVNVLIYLFKHLESKLKNK